MGLLDLREIFLGILEAFLRNRKIYNFEICHPRGWFLVPAEPSTTLPRLSIHCALLSQEVSIKQSLHSPRQAPSALGHRRLRLSEFLDNQHMKVAWQGCQPYTPVAFIPQEIPLVLTFVGVRGGTVG
jgi:hypothetical protein